MRNNPFRSEIKLGLREVQSIHAGTRVQGGSAIPGNPPHVPTWRIRSASPSPWRWCIYTHSYIHPIHTHTCYHTITHSSFHAHARTHLTPDIPSPLLTAPSVHFLTTPELSFLWVLQSTSLIDNKTAEKDKERTQEGRSEMKEKQSVLD